MTSLPPWPQLSFCLAKQLVKLDIHKSFLTPVETDTLTHSLHSYSTWKDFISSSTNNLIAFRVRAMLSEQFIQSNQEQRCCSHSQIDLNQLCHEARQLDIQSCANTSSPTPSSQQHQQQTEQAQEANSNSDHVPLLDIYHTLEFDMAAMIEQRKLEEHQAQEEAQDQAAAAAAAAAAAISTAFSILNDHNGNTADSFSLKYLSIGISENRNKIQLSDRELRNLLQEIKPHRSKWANEDKVGQEDLYEACEKVLTDLKNYTEHSTPFLSKVNKREAPDYFEVITNPMDLGTVSKKLKHFQYKTKKEFGNDLYLIYENCLKYNTNPSSEYRKHAIAMRRKTDKLLTRVPDIVVKEEGENMDMEESSDTEDRERRSMTQDSFVADAPPISGAVAVKEPHVHTGGKHPQKGTTSQTTHDEIDKEHEELTMTQELDNDKGELQNQLWREITKKTRAKLTTDVEKQHQFDFGNREALTRSSLDMSRYNMMEHLHHEAVSTKKLMRCKKSALSRWISSRQTSVYDTFDLTSEDEQEDLDDGGGFFFMTNKREHKAEPTDEDDAIRTDLFLYEYNMTAGLPEIQGVAEEYHMNELDEDDREELTLDIYPATQEPHSELNEKIHQNRSTISNIRSIYNKCQSIRDNTPLHVPPTITAVSTPSAEEMMVDTGTPIPSSSQQLQQPQPLIVTEDASQQMIQRSLTHILSHAGFQSADAKALNILTDLMTEHLSNIGKTARKYLDEHSKNMSSSDILHQTLKENGVPQGGLAEYVTRDIERFGNKLQDVHSKLETSYRDLVAGVVDEDMDVDLFEDEDAFITGGLFEKDLVEEEDFFGFKELGLDQDMKSLVIPPRLLFGKEKLKSLSKQEPAAAALKYLSPPAFQPVTSASAFIGLLKPWYEQRQSVIEDEFLPHKNQYKYPPIHLRSALLFTANKSSRTPKRKVLKDGSNTQQTSSSNNSAEDASTKQRKKLKKNNQEELKLQKKKQKVEQKALKAMEREQKKKLREEEKLAKKRRGSTGSALQQ